MTAPSGQTVMITFNTFALEYNGNCAYDWIIIYEGSGTSGTPLLNKTCGTTNPGSITSTSQQATLLFHTDSSATMTGFEAQLSSGVTFTLTTGVTTTTSATTSSSGTTTTATTTTTASSVTTTTTPAGVCCSGCLCSPNYPNNYDNNLRNEYIIEASVGNDIVITSTPQPGKLRHLRLRLHYHIRGQRHFWY